MTDTVFVDQSAATPIVASWLNDVNKTTYEALGALGVAPTTPLQVRTNLGIERTQKVVSSIAALQAISKLLFTEAIATGYYAQGDGGGGSYWYDSTDTTSADNGGTIIVASDGGRWKLAFRDKINVKQFGAKGDGVANDDTAIQAALTVALALKLTLYFPAGFYLYSSTVDWTQGVGVSIKGDGIFTTFLYQKNGGTNGAIRINGGLGSLLSGTLYNITNQPGGCISDFTIASNTGPAINYNKCSNMIMERVCTFFSGTAYATLDINGGSQCQYTDCYIGPSNIELPYNLATYFPGQTNELYSLRMQPSGATRVVMTEHTFENCRIGKSNATAGSIYIQNPDAAVYDSFGNNFVNCHLKGYKLIGVPSLVCIEIDSAQATFTGGHIESSGSDGANSISVQLRNTYGTCAFFNKNFGITGLFQKAQTGTNEMRYGNLSFFAQKSANTANVLGGAAGTYTVIPDTVAFDQSGGYSSATGIFTAPMDGKYRLSFHGRVYGLDGTAIEGKIVTTGAYANSYISDQTWAPAATVTITNVIISAVVPMKRGATAKCQLTGTGGTAVGGVTGSATAYTWFEGERVEEFVST